MPLRDDILKPIPATTRRPNLRYAPVYDKIKEARREDDELPQGAWQHERKVADTPGHQTRPKPWRRRARICSWPHGSPKP